MCGVSKLPTSPTPPDTMLLLKGLLCGVRESLQFSSYIMSGVPEVTENYTLMAT